MIRLRFEYSAAQVLAAISEFSRHASEPAQLSTFFGDRGCSRLKDLIFREAADCDLQQLNTAHFLKNPDFNTSVQLRAGAPCHFNPALALIHGIYMRNSFSVWEVIHKIATNLARGAQFGPSKGAPHALY